MEDTKVQEKQTFSKSQFEVVEEYLNLFYEFRYNEISNEVEYRKKEIPDFKPLNENNLYRDLQHGGFKFSQANLSALLRSDFVPTFNPFKNYFENLPEWNPDTNPDYIEKLAIYVKAVDQDRFNYHFKKMLVRVIACALVDSIFNKQAFVLVGYTQNSGKSTFCRFLCPRELDEYITETFSPDKDGQISLAENLFINLDELASLSKYEINQLKSSFSKDKIKIRRPFEKKATTSARRASFLGSTNKAEFLTDETGSVRWLCFEINKIKWDYKEAVKINEVWSQAYALYKNGFKYNITAEDIQENDLVNKKFQKITPEAELISKKYEPGTLLNNERFTTPFEIATTLNSEYSGSYKFTAENVGRALTFLGFERVQKRTSGANPIYGYYINRKIENDPATLTINEEEPLPF
jgi:predicted P-loop ATPase